MQISVAAATAGRARSAGQSMARILVVAVFVVFSFVALGTGVARHFATPANVTSEVGGNFVPRQSADYHAGAERPIPPVKMPKS